MCFSFFNANRFPTALSRKDHPLSLHGHRKRFPPLTEHADTSFKDGQPVTFFP